LGSGNIGIRNASGEPVKGSPDFLGGGSGDRPVSDEKMWKSGGKRWGAPQMLNPDLMGMKPRGKILMKHKKPGTPMRSGLW